MRLNDIPRLKLGYLPTPLDDAPRLAEKIGLDRLFIKRDDLTGLALGGNKVRKLEFLLAEAKLQGADVVITTGAHQSNHARLTAAAAVKLGMCSILFLGGTRPERLQGNLLLDSLLGADIRLLPGVDMEQMKEEMQNTAEELKRAGKKPYIIPVGGSTPLGSLGYVAAMEELAGQLDGETAPQIVLAAGSGGTMAGVLLGARLFLPRSKVVGISVSRTAADFRNVIAGIANGAAELIGVSHRFDPASVDVNDEYLGESYGVPTEAGMKAISLGAQTEALLFDPVYTGKAMSGLIDLVSKGVLARDRTTVFIHTGGIPGLFVC